MAKKKQKSPPSKKTKTVKKMGVKKAVKKSAKTKTPTAKKTTAKKSIVKVQYKAKKTASRPVSKKSKVSKTSLKSKAAISSKAKAPTKSSSPRKKGKSGTSGKMPQALVLKNTTALVSKTPPGAGNTENEAVRVQAEIVDHHPASRPSNELTPVGDSLSFYLAGINKYPLLSRQQEMQIAERYFKDKNPQDAEILVTSNLRFVVKIAAEYSKFGNRLIDLIQEGNVGLMHAVKEYNPYKGARLITYAVWWIRGYIQEYLMRQHSMVRIGTTQNQRKLFYHLRKEKEKLDQMGQESSVKLLSARLGIPEGDIKMMEERMSGKDISLDAPIGDDQSAARIDLSPSDELGADDLLAQRETLQILDEKISHLRPSLSDKEIYLLDNRLLADTPITLQDIGTEWGVTREAVRQMEARLMKKIKLEMEKLEPVN
jgi:RNA polymerase sigma-32 factor